MYDDVKFDWRTIAVHDEKNIKGFFGNYRWLSNFQGCWVYYDWNLYPSVENAYMAAKVIPEEREYFLKCTAKEAKANWKNFTLIDKSPSDWDKRKFEVMYECLWEKFTRNKELKEKLLATEFQYLEETNWWKDTIWGVDHQLGGKNHLGHMIMNIRACLRHQQSYLQSFNEPTLQNN